MSSDIFPRAFTLFEKHGVFKIIEGGAINCAD
jgi:hypothetical protein